MTEAQAQALVCARLDRIEAMRAAGAKPADVMAELAHLRAEGDQLARLSGNARIAAAVADLADALGGIGQPV